MRKRPVRTFLTSLNGAAFGAALVVVVVAGFLSTPDAEARHPSCRDLHAAAFLDEPGEMKGLIQHGVDINCLDQFGQTPLVTAVNGASFQCFKILMDAGAKVDVLTEYGKPILVHTRAKVASLNVDGGDNLQALYRQMADRLEAAGAPLTVPPKPKTAPPTTQK